MNSTDWCDGLQLPFLTNALRPAGTSVNWTLSLWGTSLLVLTASFTDRKLGRSCTPKSLPAPQALKAVTRREGRLRQRERRRPGHAPVALQQAPAVHHRAAGAGPVSCL